MTRVSPRTAWVAAALIVACACGRNEERKVGLVDVSGLLRPEFAGTYRAETGNTIVLEKKDRWEVGLGIFETQTVTLEISIEAVSQRANVKFVFPKPEYRDPPVFEVRSSLAANDIGFFGRPSTVDFGLVCDYFGSSPVDKLIYIPTLPSGTKTKYDWSIESFKSTFPEVNYAILTNFAFFRSRAAMPVGAVGSELESLADQPLRKDIQEALRKGCDSFGPSTNQFSYYSGIALEKFDSDEIEIVSSHGRGYQKPVVYKGARERRFRKVR